MQFMGLLECYESYYAMNLLNKFLHRTYCFFLPSSLLFKCDQSLQHCKNLSEGWQRWCCPVLLVLHSCTTWEWFIAHTHTHKHFSSCV